MRRVLAVLTLNDPGLHNDPVREVDLWPGWIRCQWGLIENTKGRDLEDLKAETREIMLAGFQ